jgi:hypothetical protein
MADHPPLRDWLRPRLVSVLRDARAAGYEPETAVAVIIDLVTSQDFNLAAPDPETALPTDHWQQAVPLLQEFANEPLDTNQVPNLLGVTDRY